MKKSAPIILILCISFLLAGCSNFRIATTIDDLISPIAPSGENADVQNAVDEYCKGGYSLKAPSKGKYRTSFVFYDLDGDKNNEAVAFYEPSNELGTVNMAVLKKKDNKWSVAENIKAQAADVNSVDFCDLTDNGDVEIVVSWSAISKSTSFDLNVYRRISDDNSYKLKKINHSVTVSDFVCADVNNDGVNEILAFTDGAYAGSPKAELYSYKDNDAGLIGETKLDSSITSFRNIIVGETDQGVSVYADALKSDGSSMVTELIYWSDYYDSIVSPFYSYSSGKTAETSRNNVINSMDINNDGSIEIPVDASVKGLPSEISAQKWMEYKNTVLSNKCYSLSCRRDGYIITVSNKNFPKISVKYDADKRTMKVLSKKDKKVIFEIYTVISSEYNPGAAQYKNYEEIFSDSGFVYLAKINGGADFKITADELKK